MADVTNTLNLIGARHQFLTKENMRLERELKVAKELLVSIDRKREGNLRTVRAMRLNWMPVDETDAALLAVKSDEKAYSEWMAYNHAAVFNDTAFCTRRAQQLNDYITSEAEKHMSDMERIERECRDAYWARQEKVKA